MAQSIFDALSGVCLDSSTVQSLLESQNLMPEVEQSGNQSPTVYISPAHDAYTSDPLDLDEEDIFQCGKCKCQFTSLNMFLQHKQTHVKKPEEATVDLSQYLVNDSSQVDDPCRDAQYNPSETFIQANELTESIILEESDMLFSMDEEGASYLTADSAFVPIILSENLENFSTHSVTDDNLLQKDDVNSLESPDTNFPATVETTPVALDSTDLDDQENTSSPQQSLKYKCNYCQKQFAKKFYWQQHERSHTGEKPYQCVVCGRAFAQKSNVKKHMSSHKVWPGTAIHSLPPEAPADGSIDRTYHCQFCKEIFDSYKALKGHLIESHLTLKVYKCVQSSCSMMFAELDDFLEHTRSHKRSEYRCHVCGQVFNTLSDLGLHQYVHSVQKQKTTEKYYCCDVCKSSFANLEALQHHRETTTHDYACPHCGKSFLIERFLRRHLKTHVASARFACEDCGKAFKTEQYLANHRLIHSEETPFVCPQCPARFKRKDRLGRHMLIHDLSKRLKCPFRGFLGCMSEFSRPDKLKRHLLTHSNIKRFDCGHCNRHFNRTQALKHFDSKHTLTCEICKHVLKSKDQLISHSCDPSCLEPKKHSNSQLKKACATFKARKPTPKRQIMVKPALGAVEKEKIKTEDLDRRVISSESGHLENFGESCEKKILVESCSIAREINSTIDALMRPDNSSEDEMTTEMDFQSM